MLNSAVLSYWHGKPLRAVVPLLYWHVKPEKKLRGCCTGTDGHYTQHGVVVLERQTSEKLRLCRTGSVAHFKSYADDVLARLTSEKLRR